MTALAEVFSAALLGSSVYVLLWLFLIYSFLGVVVEMIFCLVVDGVLESRSGLLFLPLRPIYGLGGVACTVPLQLTHDPLALFLLGMVSGTVIEYGAGLVVEKVFGTTAWDYRDKRWNLHGRVCLQYSAGWGLLALVVAYVLDPVLSGLLAAADRRQGEPVLTVLLVATALTGVVTTAALLRLRRRVAALRSGVPGQPASVGPTAWERLLDRLAPEALIITTFPGTSAVRQLVELTGAEEPSPVPTPRRSARRPGWGVRST